MMNNKFLSLIKAGMNVVDADGKQIGTVKTVYFGGDSEEMNRNDPYQNTLPDIIANVFAGDSNIPQTLQNRMEQEGFIVVDKALAVDPYILPDQIAGVSGDTITLNSSDVITR